MDGYEKLVCVDISVKITNATGISAIFKCAIKVVKCPCESV